MLRFRRPRLRALATVAAATVVAGALLMGPVLLFGAFALRTTLIDLNTRNDHDRQETAALAATVVARGMASRGEQVSVLVARDDFVDATARKDTAALEAMIVPSVAGFIDVVSAGVLDETGRVIARYPVDPAVLGQSLGDRDYFVGAVQSSGVVVGSIVTSRLDPTLVVVPLAAAIRQGGVTRGVIAMSVRPAALLSELQKVQSSDGRELVIVDKSGATIASTAKRQALAPLGLPESPVGTTDVDGKTRAYVASPIEGTTWRLYVLDDLSLIYAAQRRLSTELGAPLMLAILAAGLLAAILAAGWIILANGRERLRVANVQLANMNESVQAATRAKSDFLANMSHELRTPLNAVLGFSDVLLEQLRPSITDRQARYLTNIHGAGAHLLELINDVLDLSKVEAGRLQLRPEVVTLPTLLEPVIASTAQLAADRGVRFEVLDVPSGTALVDASRVRQVLLNLLSNAVKFSKPGGLVRLDVATRGQSLQFDVIDDGIGIPADKRDKVFGVFERLHEGKSDAAGTGLGLAITKKLVELQHGTIDFESEEGHGTRFWIVLEDVMVEAAVGPRILIVEDDQGDAELLTELARECGHRVEVAPNAASALASIARSLPTAVVLDLRLPDRRGDDVLRALKSDPNTARVPVLIVSVEDDDGRLRPMGAEDHITKPIDRERLQRWLRAVGAGGGALARVAG